MKYDPCIDACIQEELDFQCWVARRPILSKQLFLLSSADQTSEKIAFSVEKCLVTARSAKIATLKLSVVENDPEVGLAKCEPFIILDQRLMCSKDRQKTSE